MRAPWICALALLAAATPASADDVTRAKTHFALGARAYEASRFRVAIEAFQEAHRLAPHPALLFSIAQASRRQYFLDRKPDDLRRAVQSYRSYIEQAPEGSRRGEAAAALAELEPMAERMGASAGGPAPPAEVKPVARIMVAASVKTAVATIDRGAVLKLPTSAEVSPGKHLIRMQADGYYDEEREIQAVVGESFALDVAMRERPALVQLRAEDGAQVFVDGRLVGATPLARPLEIPSGRRFLAVTKTGRTPYSSEVDFRRAESKLIAAPLSDTTQRRISYGLMATGGAGVIAGAVFAGLAFGEQRTALDIDEQAASGNIGEADRQSHADALAARQDFQRAAAGAFLGGAVLGVSGFLLYLFDASTPTAPPRGPEPAALPPGTEPAPEPPSMLVSGQPLWGPGFVGAAVSGRF